MSLDYESRHNAETLGMNLEVGAKILYEFAIVACVTQNIRHLKEFIRFGNIY